MAHARVMVHAPLPKGEHADGFAMGNSRSAKATDLGCVRRPSFEVRVDQYLVR